MILTKINRLIRVFTTQKNVNYFLLKTHPAGVLGKHQFLNTTLYILNLRVPLANDSQNLNALLRIKTKT